MKYDLLFMLDSVFFPSMTAKEVGLSDIVLESLAQCLSRSPSEIKVCICEENAVFSVSSLFFFFFVLRKNFMTFLLSFSI